MGVRESVRSTFRVIRILGTRYLRSAKWRRALARQHRTWWRENRPGGYRTYRQWRRDPGGLGSQAWRAAQRAEARWWSLNLTPLAGIRESIREWETEHGGPGTDPDRPGSSDEYWRLLGG